MSRTSPAPARLVRLSARMDAHLKRFATDEEEDRPHRSNAQIGARVAVAGAAGAAGLAYKNREKIKGGVTKAKEVAGNARAKVRAGAASAKEAGRTAAFRGMRTTAGVMNKGSLIADKASRSIPYTQQGARKGAAKISDVLKKGAKKLRKGSMAMFDRGTADRIIQLADRIARIELGR